ncbi:MULTISPECIES: hypothetical protein [unclassified Desulfurobacterium]|uniref:hypothetical protein n=1 Tax=Desulfurobacterium sp. TC5-1 TaxID=1158318 RepID=UPI0003B63120|nr:hypothetical protein [Desulfurobacterium sp. TC5-1]
MEKVKLFFSSLSDKERWWLILGIYAVVILGGGFILLPSAFNSYFREKKELKNVVSEFYSFKKLLSEAVPEKSGKPVSLKDVSSVLTVSGIKPFVVSIKPSGNNFEIKIDGAPMEVFSSALKIFKNRGFSVLYMNVDTVTGKVKALLTVSGERQ